MDFIIIVIAVVFIIEGIPYLMTPEKVKRWSMSIQEVPNKHLRLIGLLCMILGLVALYLVKNL
ncbi:MAG: DUF2065 domain-containing protein [Deltaproteobacteria bacterium]|nr:DUF2065 domain-containing protein [Deltaproteobacteria bacterium]